MTSPDTSISVGPSSAPKWVLVTGVSFLGVAFLFLIFLACLTITQGKPDLLIGTEHIVNLIASMALAIGAAFIGGYAKAEGKIKFAKWTTPIQFSVGGGIATFIIVLAFLTAINPKGGVTTTRAHVINLAAKVNQLCVLFSQRAATPDGLRGLHEKAVLYYNQIGSFQNEKLESDALVEKYVTMASTIAMAGVLTDEMDDVGKAEKVKLWAALGVGACTRGLKHSKEIAEKTKSSEIRGWVRGKDDYLLYYKALCRSLELKHTEDPEERTIIRAAVHKDWAEIQSPFAPMEPSLINALSPPAT